MTTIEVPAALLEWWLQVLVVLTACVVALCIAGVLGICSLCIGPTRPGRSPRHVRALGAVLLMAIIPIGSAAARQAPAAQSPRELFECARMLEESNTRLFGAIAVYAQVKGVDTPARTAGSR
jgi:hypothetical protein